MLRLKLRQVIDNKKKDVVFDFMDLDLKQCMDSRFREGMPDELIKSCMQQMLRILSGGSFPG